MSVDRKERRGEEGGERGERGTVRCRKEGPYKRLIALSRRPDARSSGGRANLNSEVTLRGVGKGEGRGLKREISEKK